MNVGWIWIGLGLTVGAGCSPALTEREPSVVETPAAAANAAETPADAEPAPTPAATETERDACDEAYEAETERCPEPTCNADDPNCDERLKRDANSACHEQAAFYFKGCKCGRPDADAKECEESADDESE